MNNSMAGRLSGTVSYTNGSVGFIDYQFVINGSVSSYWSLDEDASRQVVGDLESSYPGTMTTLLSAISGITTMVFMPRSGSGRSVSKFILHLSATITSTNGTTSFLTLEYDGTSVRSYDLPGSALSQDYIDKLFEVFSRLSNGDAVANDDRPIKVVDAINDGVVRRVLLFSLNYADEADPNRGMLAWKDLPVKGNFRRFDHVASVSLTGEVGGDAITACTVTTGKRYGQSGGAFVEIGDSVSPTEFEVKNQLDFPIRVSTVKDGDIIQTITINPGEIFAIRYRPTVWVYAITGTGAAPTYADVQSVMNTEMSFLGVTTADMLMTKVGDAYVFTLQNIT
jgi:hypothetical protein